MRYGLGAALLMLTVLLTGCFTGNLRVGDLLVGTPTPKPSKMPTEVPTITSVSSGHKPYGRILFSSAGKIWMWQDGDLRQLTDGQNDIQAAWASDGKRIAYVARSENSSDLYTLRVDTGSFEQLTAYRASRTNVWVFKPAWAPDGRLLSFLTDLSAN